MARDIHIRAVGVASYAAVRSALSGLDVSEKSPVSATGREVGLEIGDGEIHLRVEGHPGEFSKQSQSVLLAAVQRVDGVDSAQVVAGGYDPSVDEADDGDDGDDGDGDDVETITGVGPGRAELLRSAGIETVADVIDVGADGLMAAGLPEGVAENIVEAAG